MKTRIKKGDLFVAYPDNRPCERLYITVTRVARDGTWADIHVQTWAVAWTKRQKLTDAGGLPDARDGEWDARDLLDQERDHMAKLRETGVLP